MRLRSDDAPDARHRPCSRPRRGPADRGLRRFHDELRGRECRHHDGSLRAKKLQFLGLVDIGGGRKMYMKCRGTGSPTVVLVSGLGNAADIWSVTADPKNERPVFAEVARFTRVCAYDRPGTTRADETLVPFHPSSAADLGEARGGGPRRPVGGAQGNLVRTCSPDTPSAARSSGSTQAPIPPRWADSSSSTPSPKTCRTG